MTDPQPWFTPVVGVAEKLAPGLRRILADNPSPMTYRGTNTYLLGSTDIAVIDPGPNSAPHLDAILSALTPEQRITHILVTHAHVDHSQGAAPLAARTGAPILAFGPPDAGRSDVMRQLAATGFVGGGEGVDQGFTPNKIVQDGDIVEGPDWALRALHSPGHFCNHLAFAWGDTLFVGDLVMGWATSLVSPPDGDLTQFMVSCTRLAETEWRVFHPGHGAPINAPNARLSELIAHRRSREAQIMAALADRPTTAHALTQRIYTDTPPALHAAAERNVLSHLIDLTERNLARPQGHLHAQATFECLV